MSHGHGGGHGHGHGPQPVIIQLLPWHWITNLIKLAVIGLGLLILWAWLGTWGLLLLIFGPFLLWSGLQGAMEAHRQNMAEGGYFWQRKP